MSPEQLKQAGEALFGPQWQTALARSLGMSDASLFRKVMNLKNEKYSQVGDQTARRIALLLAHDEWIVGDGSDSRAEYIVHTRYPRFIARIVSDAAGDEGDTLSGITYGCADGDATLCEFIWSDKVPEGQELSRLLARADAALQAIALDDII